MNVVKLDEEAIFHVARSIGAAEARDAYLEQVCGDDRACATGSRRCCASASRRRASSKLPPCDATVDVRRPRSSGPGTVIGPYKLLEQIGEGGMGVVYMAEQHAARPPQGRAEDHQAGHGLRGR